jgi:hypothetical protein
VVCCAVLCCALCCGSFACGVCDFTTFLGGSMTGSGSLIDFDLPPETNSQVNAQQFAKRQALAEMQTQVCLRAILFSISSLFSSPVLSLLLFSSLLFSSLFFSSLSFLSFFLPSFAPASSHILRCMHVCIGCKCCGAAFSA